MNVLACGANCHRNLIHISTSGFHGRKNVFTVLAFGTHGHNQLFNVFAYGGAHGRRNFDERLSCWH